MVGIYNVPPAQNLIDALARQLLTECAQAPLELADYLVILPTKRGVRSLTASFLRQSEGQALILPKMISLGEAESPFALEGELTGSDNGDDAGLAPVDVTALPTLSPLKRAFVLSELVQAAGQSLAARPISEEQNRDPLELSPDQAFRMAQGLGLLLDQADTEGVTLNSLPNLGEDQGLTRELAKHWEVSLDFLKILFAVWPNLLASMNQSSAAEARRLKLEALTHAWRMQAPAAKIIAAGSTGSIPATRDLLATVAGLPNGRLLLPGLDRVMDGDDWDEVRRTPSHAQHNLITLLDRAETSPDEVMVWPSANAALAPREALLSRAMLPAKSTVKWRRSEPLPQGALAKVFRLDCDSPDEEARAVALILRESLEQPERRTTLVTPDRTLARRVIQWMRRWDIDLDDSAGRPLRNSAHGLYLRAALDCLAASFSPLSLAALLKHPLAHVTIEPDRLKYKGLITKLEGALLHGERPARGLSALDGLLTQKLHAQDTPGGRHDQRFTLDADAEAFARALFERLAPLECTRDPEELRSFAQWLDVHLGLMNACCDGDAFWRGQDAEDISTLFEELADAAQAQSLAIGKGFDAITFEHYRDIFEAALAPQVSRGVVPTHPRLAIQGTLEARLDQTDRIVLAGLNEGIWPTEPKAGPWLSNAMRADLGLPLPERRIGLQAHDFAQAFGANEVWITRTAKESGSQTRPARWLARLDALMEGQALTYDKPPFDPLALAQTLEPGRLSTPQTITRPIACPPVELRPKKLSITEIETWFRDPYAIYARHVLGLTNLEGIDEEPSIRERGKIVHAALEEFFKKYPERVPDGSTKILEAMAQPLFDELRERAPSAAAFWWPRFQRVAKWIAETEQARGDAGLRRFVEARAEGDLLGFKLTGYADRLDLLENGSVDILDYKVGTPPTVNQVKQGWAPQLALEGMLIEQAHFGKVPEFAQPRAVNQLIYWKVGGSGSEAVKPTTLDAKASAEAIATVRERLSTLIQAYALPNQAYSAVPDPAKRPAYSDYKLLARWDAWLGEAEAEAEGEDA